MNAPSFTDRQIGGEEYDEDYELVLDEYMHERRWGHDQKFVLHRKSDDTFWRFIVYMPATENQDYSDFPVAATQVEPIVEQITRTTYVRVEAS